jgi:hypothetical protein
MSGRWFIANQKCFTYPKGQGKPPVLTGAGQKLEKGDKTCNVLLCIIIQQYFQTEFGLALVVVVRGIFIWLDMMKGRLWWALRLVRRSLAGVC